MSVQPQPQATTTKKDGRSARDKAQAKAGERELAQDEMVELEAGDVPAERRLAQWPGSVPHIRQRG
jgi:hypothetical protein